MANTHTKVQPIEIADPIPISYEVSEKDIAELRAKYGGITFRTKEGYETGRLGIARCREHMGAIEKARADWVRESRRREKMVNQEADRVTEPIEKIRAELQAKKDEVDREVERERKAKEEAKRLAFEAEERRKREAEHQRLKEENDRLVQEARKVLEDKENARVEAARLAKERAELEEQKRQQEAEALRIKEESDRLKANQITPAATEESVKKRDLFEQSIEVVDAVAKARGYALPETDQPFEQAKDYSGITSVGGLVTRLAQNEVDEIRNWCVLIRDVIPHAPECMDPKRRLAVLQAVDELTAVAITLEDLQ